MYLLSNMAILGIHVTVVSMIHRFGQNFRCFQQFRHVDCQPGCGQPWLVSPWKKWEYFTNFLPKFCSKTRWQPQWLRWLFFVGFEVFGVPAFSDLFCISITAEMCPPTKYPYQYLVVTTNLNCSQLWYNIIIVCIGTHCGLNVQRFRKWPTKNHDWSTNPPPGHVPPPPEIMPY